MTRARHDGPVRAIIAGVSDLFTKGESIGSLQDGDRIDGKTCLVTGANGGLGLAIAAQLAQRGGRVLMACRTQDEKALRHVRAMHSLPRGEQERGTRPSHRGEASGGDARMLYVDLSSLDSVRALADRLAQENERIDIMVNNAGMVAGAARQTGDGFDEMRQVNYLAPYLLIRRLLASGVLPGWDTGERPEPIPRVVIVASEAHRSALAFDPEQLTASVQYGMSGSMAQYGLSKLLLLSFARQLEQRLVGQDGQPRVAVHGLCPGPVASNIARDAPGWSQPLLKAVFRLTFRSPQRACEPAIFLACSPTMEGKTGTYLHLMQPKQVDARATDADFGRRLWDASARAVGL